MALASLPAIYDALRNSANLAADDLLLSTLEDLETEYQIHALVALFDRGQQGVLAQLVERYHSLSRICQGTMENHIDRLETTLREAMNSTQEQTRLNAIGLVSRCHCAAMAYIVGMGLHSSSSDTRARAAIALRDLAIRLAGRDTSERLTPAALARPQSHYDAFSAREAQCRMLQSTMRDALDGYDNHLRTAVIDAVALLSLPMEQDISRAVSRPRSKFWRAFVEMVRQEPKPVAATLAVQALRIKGVRDEIAKVISTCRETPFMLELFKQCWLLGDRDVADGCKLIRRLHWLDEGADPLLKLRGTALRGAIRFINAANIPEEQALDWYRALLLSPDSDKQRAALFSVASIDSEASSEVLRVVLDWGDPGLRSIAARVLAARGAEVLAIARWQSQSSDAPVPNRSELLAGCVDFEAFWNNYDHMTDAQRSMVGLRLLKSDPGFNSGIDQKLGSPRPAERARAVNVVRLLSLTKDHRERILKCAVDQDRFVRSTAVKALAQIDSLSSEALLTGALTDVDSRVRANAIEAMEESATPTRMVKIMPSLQDSEHRVRAAAIKALLKLRVREAADSLLRMLHEPSKAQRMSALWVVEKYGLAEIVSHVAELARDDPDPAVKKRAQRLLRREKRSRRNYDAPIPPPKEEHQV